MTAFAWCPRQPVVVQTRPLRNDKSSTKRIPKLLSRHLVLCAPWSVIASLIVLVETNGRSGRAFNDFIYGK